jgi:hypothetical protein
MPWAVCLQARGLIIGGEVLDGLVCRALEGHRDKRRYKRTSTSIMREFSENVKGGLGLEGGGRQVVAAGSQHPPL